MNSFLGLSDQVKCFYCDGGLREWRDGDDPWQEHAGWFPKVFAYCLNRAFSSLADGLLRYY